MEIVYQKNKDKQPVYDMYQEIFEDPDSDEWKKEYKENMDLLNDRLRKLKTYIYKTED